MGDAHDVDRAVLEHDDRERLEQEHGACGVREQLSELEVASNARRKGPWLRRVTLTAPVHWLNRSSSPGSSVGTGRW